MVLLVVLMKDLQERIYIMSIKRSNSTKLMTNLENRDL